MSASKMEAKRAKMLARLDARRPKPSQNADQNAPTATSDGGAAQLLVEFADIQQMVATEMDNLERQKEADFETAAGGVDRLRKLLQENADALSAFEARKAQATIQQLSRRLEDARGRCAPKAAFSFAKRPQKSPPAVTAESDTTESRKSIDSVEEAKSPSAAEIIATLSQEKTEMETEGTTIRLSHKTAVIEVIDEQCDGKDVCIDNLSGCTVYIRGSASTVHLTQLEDTVVVCAPVFTSVFVDDCQRLTLAAVCQQLRMHNTTRADVYVHVTSGAIIENCRQMRFAPLPAASLEGGDGESMLNRGFELTRLNRDRNNWDKVQDFDWLSNDHPSPNWSVLPAEERRRFRYSPS